MSVAVSGLSQSGGWRRRPIGIEHAISQDVDTGSSAHRTEFLPDRLQRTGRDVGPADVDHDHGGDDAGRQVDQSGCIMNERLPDAV
jgi:hypothetical protein